MWVRMHLIRSGSEYLPVSKCIIFVLVHHALFQSLEDRGSWKLHTEDAAGNVVMHLNL